MKWLHCRILRDLVSARAAETNGAETAGAKPGAPAATPMVLRKSRRVAPRLSLRDGDDIPGPPNAGTAPAREGDLTLSSRGARLRLLPPFGGVALMQVIA